MQSVRRTLLTMAAVLSMCVGATGALTGTALAQGTELVYSTFLDPNNGNDPRAAAQTKVIQAFERQNPDIKIKLLVDPTGQSVSRSIKSRSDTPDVVRIVGFAIAEYAATGNLVALDDLVKRDGISGDDWLLPLASAQVYGSCSAFRRTFGSRSSSIARTRCARRA